MCASTGQPYGRVFNFSAGPACLPIDVLEKAQDELLNWRGRGTLHRFVLKRRLDLHGEILLAISQDELLSVLSDRRDVSDGDVSSWKGI